MAEAAVRLEPPGVEAALNYVVDTGIKPVSETFGPGPGGLMRRTSGTYEKRVVHIADARGLRGAFRFDVNGFEFVDHPTRVKNFLDGEEIRAVYYPEMQQLIARHSGAARVHVFDHTVRSSDEAVREAQQLREPVKSVHNDYTEWSGPQRVRDIMGEEAEELLRRRFAIVQVWRPIGAPVRRDPLAIADARSLAAQDLIAAERRFPNRVDEIYQVQYNPSHRWYYLSGMNRNEALVFKVYDSMKDGRARWSAHTSFDDPTTPPDAPPRESIEIRAFAFFAA